jgi:formylmethanofuran dehydrogenase subunit A
MPTVLLVKGWRFFFYSNEMNEPIHIHCRKGDKECKYWLDSKKFDVREAFSYNMNDKDRRQIMKMIYEYFEYIEDKWSEFQSRGSS